MIEGIDERVQIEDKEPFSGGTKARQLICEDKRLPHDYAYSTSTPFFRIYSSPLTALETLSAKYYFISITHHQYTADLPRR
jgi:hypothetical protein